MERFKKRLTSRTHMTARTRDHGGFFGAGFLYIAFSGALAQELLNQTILLPTRYFVVMSRSVSIGQIQYAMLELVSESGIICVSGCPFRAELRLSCRVHTP